MPRSLNKKQASLVWIYVLLHHFNLPFNLKACGNLPKVKVRRPWAGIIVSFNVTLSAKSNH